MAQMLPMVQKFPEIAEKIGGGGHKMAAGARIEGKSLEEAEKIVFTLCKDVLK